MQEIYSRGLSRTQNNPIADYAERLVAEKLELALVANSTTGYDAVGREGTRYQIKACRITPGNPSRQLGTLRRLGDDSFDFPVIAVFGPMLELQELWRLPIGLVREHARYSRHVNGYVLHAKGAVLKDPRADRLT